MMIDDDNDDQLIFGDLGGLKHPDICHTGEEKHRKNLAQENCPDRGSNPGPLRDRRASYLLAHSGGQIGFVCVNNPRETYFVDALHKYFNLLLLSNYIR